jgi:hypothetical protein
MFIGNRLNNNKNFLGNRLQSTMHTIGNYMTPDNITKGAKLAIAVHQAHSDIEKYRNKKHD